MTSKPDAIRREQQQLAALWRNRRILRSYHRAGYAADVRYVLHRLALLRQEGRAG